MRRGARATSSRPEGSGPTADDVTVAAVAAWLGASLQRNEPFLEKMRQRFARRGFEMPACNAKQADFIVGARVLENPRGHGARLLGRARRHRDRHPARRSVRDEGDHGVERPARPARARGRRRRAAPRPAHRRDGGVGRRGARGARLREVEGRSRHDPGVAGRGAAAPVRDGPAARGRGEARGDGVGLPRHPRRPHLRRGHRGPRAGRGPPPAGGPAHRGARGVVHGRDGVLAR